MRDYTIYAGARRTGKTTWIITEIMSILEEDRNAKIAIVFPHASMAQHAARQDYANLPVEFFTERSFQLARGRDFDYVFVEEAQQFHDNPVELCAQVQTRSAASFTYTPYPFE